MSDNKEQTNSQENTDNVQSCCDGGSCCSSGSGGQGRSWKIVFFILIVIAAGVVLAHSFIRKSASEAAQSQQAFASVQTVSKADSPSSLKATAKAETPAESQNKTDIAPVMDNANLGKSDSDAGQSQQILASVQTVNRPDSPSPLKPEVKSETPAESGNKTEIPPAMDDTKKQEVSVKNATLLWLSELDSMASLNREAADSDVVFVFLAAEDQQSNQDIIKEIKAAIKTINADGIRVSAFNLNKTAPDYAQLTKQFSVPSVLAMVKGRGMNAVSGKISETKLVQSYVTASRPASGCAGSSGCKPGSSGCK